MFWLRCAAALLQVLRAGGSIAGIRASCMQARSRRAGIAVRALIAPRTSSSDASRRRRGRLTTLNAVWRRCSEGTNHITAFGVWRPGTRRAHARVNRDGQTRWQRPCRAAAGIDARLFDNGDLP